jgi:N-methylhydantoinase A/oxoprolinase/acetone carboxylase beta subunit
VAVRVGVDVGGTFTKAVACDETDQIVARAIVATTHAEERGVAVGVARALAEVATEVERRGLGPVTLVTHSTTQAVNALLEGDAAMVGVLGIGRRPDLERTRKRTTLGPIALAPGRALASVATLIDATDGLSREAVDAALDELVARGAQAIVISAAFGAEDPSVERMALDAAVERGLPACAGHELSGLYGLELRTLTGVINASILPISLAAAGVVEEAVERVAPGAPLLIMRGDGGAADMATLRTRPLMTAFSGPAASVAGALKRLSLVDAIVIEVGGTSTNVALIRDGRAVLRYVRVLEHQTSVRSLDVHVVGVAGGSLARVGRRLGRQRVTDVGPRSAHIAGLRYASFATDDELAGATAVLMSPRPGDAPDYIVVQTPDGRSFAPTVTCAANALGLVPDGSYARGNSAAARLAFEAIAKLTGEPWDRVARRVLDLAAAKVADTVAELASGQRLRAPLLVGVGGGVAALLPTVAARLKLASQVAPDAEVLSSVGDALSMVRVELERGAATVTPELIGQLHRQAEEEAVAAGAAPETVRVESERVPERAAIRVVAIGSAANAASSTSTISSADLQAVAAKTLRSAVELRASGGYSLFVTPGARKRDDEPFVLLDSAGGVAASGRGRIVTGTGPDVAAELHRLLPSAVRHHGPITVAPHVKIVRGPRVIDLAALSRVEEILEVVDDEAQLAIDSSMIALVVRG